MEDASIPFIIESGFITFDKGKIAIEDIVAVEVKNEPSLTSLFFFLAATYMGMVSQSLILIVVGVLNGFAFIISLGHHYLVLKTRGGDIKIASGPKEQMEKYQKHLLSIIKGETLVDSVKEH